MQVYLNNYVTYYKVISTSFSMICINKRQEPELNILQEYNWENNYMSSHIYVYMNVCLVKI